MYFLDLLLFIRLVYSLPYLWRYFRSSRATAVKAPIALPARPNHHRITRLCNNFSAVGMTSHILIPSHSNLIAHSPRLRQFLLLYLLVIVIKPSHILFHSLRFFSSRCPQFWVSWKTCRSQTTNTLPPRFLNNLNCTRPSRSRLRTPSSCRTPLWNEKIHQYSPAAFILTVFAREVTEVTVSVDSRRSPHGWNLLNQLRSSCFGSKLKELMITLGVATPQFSIGKWAGRSNASPAPPSERLTWG